MNFSKWLCLLTITTSSLLAFDADRITFEEMANQSYTEHVVAFRTLFGLKKIDRFLEFGMGIGTKFFLDNCQHVTSIEISIDSRKDAIDPWFEECFKSFKKYRNWRPLFARASAIVDYYNLPLALAYWTEMQEYLPNHLEEFQAEISQICDRLLNNDHFDLAFVDPGLFTRVDFVNALFGKVDIIAAHDMQVNIYGWPLLKEHPDYERLDYFSTFGQTTFWIKKSEAELIEALKVIWKTPSL